MKVLAIFFALAVAALATSPWPAAAGDSDTTVSKDAKDNRTVIIDQPESLDLESMNAYFANLGSIDPFYSNFTFSTNESTYALYRADPSTGGDIPKDKPLKVGFRMGGSRQHVGTLRKQRLFDAIYTSLKDACPIDSWNNCCKACQPNEAADMVQHPIVYNSGKAHYATNAHLTVSVIHGIQNPQFKGMFDAMYRMAASIYMTQAERNCYEVNFEGSRRTKMCNVGSDVAIGVPSNFGHTSLEALLYMRLEFNGKTTEGPWTCDKSLEDEVQAVAQRNSFDVKIADSIGIPVTRFEKMESTCAPLECKEWYEFRGPQC